MLYVSNPYHKKLSVIQHSLDVVISRVSGWTTCIDEGPVGVGSDGVVQDPKKKTILCWFIFHVLLEAKHAPGKKKDKLIKVYFSVTDPGCLTRIPTKKKV